MSQFVINNVINQFDLYKLAQLNGIKVEMGKGWNHLAVKLMVELDGSGWNRKVVSIKEKFGEMLFYAETHREDILDKYIDKSKTVCEICGSPGKLSNVNSWDFTRCDDHRGGITNSGNTSVRGQIIIRYLHDSAFQPLHLSYLHFQKQR